MIAHQQWSHPATFLWAAAAGHFPLPTVSSKLLQSAEYPMAVGRIPDVLYAVPHEPCEQIKLMLLNLVLEKWLQHAFVVLCLGESEGIAHHIHCHISSLRQSPAALYTSSFLIWLGISRICPDIWSGTGSSIHPLFTTFFSTSCSSFCLHTHRFLQCLHNCFFRSSRNRRYMVRIVPCIFNWNRAFLLCVRHY